MVQSREPQKVRLMQEEVTIKAAVPADAAALADLRVALALDGGATAGSAAEMYAERCRAFFTEALMAGTVLAWLGVAGSEAVAAASLELRWTFPRVRSPRALDARIRSVFVRPAFRRRGIGTALVRECIAAAAREGVDRLTLGASEMGVPLYQTLGFALREREMIYRPGR
jgi:GNAT superfamily N-acetyltransferase